MIYFTVIQHSIVLVLIDAVYASVIIMKDSEKIFPLIDFVYLLIHTSLIDEIDQRIKNGEKFIEGDINLIPD